MFKTIWVQKTWKRKKSMYNKIKNRNEEKEGGRPPCSTGARGAINLAPREPLGGYLPTSTAITRTRQNESKPTRRVRIRNQRKWRLFQSSLNRRINHPSIGAARKDRYIDELKGLVTKLKEYLPVPDQQGHALTAISQDQIENYVGIISKFRERAPRPMSGAGAAQSAVGVHPVEIRSGRQTVYRRINEENRPVINQRVRPPLLKRCRLTIIYGTYRTVVPGTYPQKMNKTPKKRE